MKELSMHVYDLMENSTAANSTEVKLTIRDSIKDNKLQASVRSAAYDMLMKIGEQYPEIRSEAIAIFDDTKDYYPHGIRKSIYVKTMCPSSHNNNAKNISLC